MICGNCKTPAAEAATVRACYVETAGACTWLVDRGYTEDGDKIIEDCGAHAVITDRGWGCEAGHDCPSLETQHREGIVYASDDEEAYHLTRYGAHDVRNADGSVWTPTRTYAA